MAESPANVSTPAAPNTVAVPLDQRFRAGAEDFQLGDDEDQNLSDFGTDHEPTPDSPADQRARVEAKEAKTTEEIVEKIAKDAEKLEKDEQAPETSEKPPETEEKPPARSPHIPRERFDEVNAKLRASQQRLIELEAAQARQPQVPAVPVEPDFDFDQHEASYMEAVLDGEKEKALEIRKKIRAAEHARVAPPAAPALDINAVKTSLKYDTVVEELNAKYPVFNPDSETFDKDLTEEAIVMCRAFQGQGIPPDMALKKAVRYVVQMNEIEEAATTAVVPVKANGKTPPTPEVKPKLDPRDVADKLKLKDQQPPAPAGQGLKEPSLDLDSMSEEEFAALPQATLRRLRGDIL